MNELLYPSIFFMTGGMIGCLLGISIGYSCDEAIEEIHDAFQ